MYDCTLDGQILMADEGFIVGYPWGFKLVTGLKLDKIFPKRSRIHHIFLYMLESGTTRRGPVESDRGAERLTQGRKGRKGRE